MYDDDNVYLMGINPVQIKAEKGILPELVEVSAAVSSDNLIITRTGIASEPLEVLYEIDYTDSNGETIETENAKATIAKGETSVVVNIDSNQKRALRGIQNAVLSVKADLNDYVLGESEDASLSVN